MQVPKNNITVRTLGWELAANDVGIARSWQERVSRFSDTTLSALLENILEPYNSNTRTYTFEKLEIDLGYLGEEHGLEEKLKHVLNEVLGKEFDKIRSREPSGKLPAEDVVALLEQLAYYFQNGHLHWASREEDFHSSDKLFLLVSGLDHATFRPWIRNAIGKDAGVVREESIIRLIEFFTEEQLEMLFEKLEGEACKLRQAHHYIKELLQRVTTSGSGKIIRYKTLLFQSLSGGDDVIDNILMKWWDVLVLDGYVNERCIARMEMTAMEMSAVDQKYEEVFHKLVKRIKNGRTQGTESNRVSEGKVSVASCEEKSRQEKKNYNHDNSYFIENAGMVLLYPYLKRFFLERSITNDRHEFPDLIHQLFACYWLQFITEGNPDVKEFQLVLPKMLCGYSTDRAVSRIWDAATVDVAVADQFLRKVIDGWEKVKTTSVTGFRQSFLLRKGKLVEEEHNWLLYVERQGLDVLLTSLPYPLSIIRFPWMTKPLYVQW